MKSSICLIIHIFIYPISHLICLIICSFLYLFLQKFHCSFSFHSFPFICLFIHSFIRPFICVFIHSTIHLFVHFSMHSFIHPFAYLSVHPSIHHLFVRLSSLIHPSVIYLFHSNAFSTIYYFIYLNACFYDSINECNSLPGPQSFAR